MKCRSCSTRGRGKEVAGRKNILVRGECGKQIEIGQEKKRTRRDILIIL